MVRASHPRFSHGLQSSDMLTTKERASAANTELETGQGKKALLPDVLPRDLVPELQLAVALSQG